MSAIQGNVTAAEVLTLAPILDGIRRGARITWVPNGDPDLIGREISGVMRHLTDTEGTGNHGRHTVPLWDQWVRISATFEHWIPIRDLVEWIAGGLAAIE